MPIFSSGFHLIILWTTGNVNANTKNCMSLAQLEAEILHFLSFRPVTMETIIGETTKQFPFIGKW